MEITNIEQLDTAIKRLEGQRISQEEELVLQFHNTIESFKPANILKSVIGDIDGSKVAGTVLKTAGSFGISLLTTKLLGGAAASTGKKLFGNLLQHTASQTAMNNVDKIKAYGTAIFHNLFNNKKNNV